MSIDWQGQKYTLPAGMNRPALSSVGEAIAAYRKALEPATTNERKKVFVGLASVLHVENMEGPAAQMRWEMYHTALRAVPLDLLEAAADDILKTDRFFPKPADFFERINQRLTERRTTMKRLQMLARGKWETEANIPDAEARARLVAETMPKFKAAKSAKAFHVKPSPHAGVKKVTRAEEEDFQARRAQVLRQCAEEGLDPSALPPSSARGR